MTIENTRNRDNLQHFMGLLGNPDNYITDMEAEGGRQVAASEELPTESPWEELATLGFVRGEVVAGNPLFTHATMPEGWSRKGTGHAMWVDIVDERGITRVSIGYKAAFYDMWARAHVTPVGSSLASAAVYAEGDVKLPECWALLTPAERDGFVWSLREDIVHDTEMIAKYPHSNDDSHYSARIARRQALLELVQS